MLVLTLQRQPPVGPALIGELSESVGYYHALTLENAAKAIPAGRYRVRLTVSERASRGELWSPREDHRLLLVADVPGRLGIRIHAANEAHELDGCIAVGQARMADRLAHSRLAVEALMTRLGSQVDDVWLEVHDALPEGQVQA